MGVYDFNTSYYSIDEVIKKLKAELQAIVINSQSNIDEIKRQISQDEALLNNLKAAVDSLPNFTEEYNRLNNEIGVLKLAIDSIKAHPIILGNIDAPGGLNSEVQKINDQFIYAEHAVKDISGRDIVDTYATKEELSQSESDIHNTISAVSAWAYDAVSAEYDERKEADDILQNAISAESARAIEEEALIKHLLTSAADEFDADLDTLYEALEAESANRASEDALLRQNIDTEVSARVNAENELWDALNDEETARIDAVSALHDEFAVSAQNLEQKITDEQTRAETSEQILQESINTEKNDREEAISALQETITNEIEAKITELSGTVETGFEQLNNVDTELSGHIDYVSAGVTALSNDLHTNYYTNTEVYNKAEVDEAIANFGGFEVHATLDEITEPKVNVIYLIGPDGLEPDLYKEYIYSNGVFVLIGDTTVDLSNYYQKDEIDGFVSGLDTAIAAETSRATDREDELDATIDSMSSSLTEQFNDMSGTFSDNIRELSSTFDTNISELSAVIDEGFEDAYNFIDEVSATAETQFSAVNNNIQDLYNTKQNNITFSYSDEVLTIRL